MKLIHKNKKAFFDYEILETFMAGIMLTGPEVKSVRAGHVNLKGSYVSIQNVEAFLKNFHISRYKNDSAPADKYDPFRTRKLLLKESELEKIIKSTNTQGITIVPLAIGLVGRYAKIEIGVARGKKKHDKRQVIKERVADRQAQRAMKNY